MYYRIKVPVTYEGPVYTPASHWRRFVNIPSRTNIRYLEIGVFYGIHLFDVARTFPSAQLYGVDPWLDYEEYPEYKGQQNTIFNGFQRNLSKCPDKSRIQAYRGFSNDIVPQFPNDYFDIIFVDGNHETEYVYKDGCMSFEKTKSGGYIVFDDMDEKDWPQTREGVRQFEKEFEGKIEMVVNLTAQIVFKKL